MDAAAALPILTGDVNGIVLSILSVGSLGCSAVESGALWVGDGPDGDRFVGWVGGEEKFSGITNNVDLVSEAS